MKNQTEIEKALDNIMETSNDKNVIFLLKDNKHKFFLDFKTILNCLAFAVKQGDLPYLPDEWCFAIKEKFNIDFQYEGIYNINSSTKNTAELTDEVYKINTDYCYEKLIFCLQDEIGRFSIGLIDILKCLYFADEKGVIPTIKGDWWSSVLCSFQLNT